MVAVVRIIGGSVVLEADGINKLPVGLLMTF